MSAKQKSRYEALPYRCLTWLCSKLDILSPQNYAMSELASTLAVFVEWSFGSWQKLKHLRMPSTSTESTSLRPPSVDFGSVSRLQSPVPRREGVMLRCYRSNSGLKGSCLRPLAPCGSRASSDTASRQCSPIPESVESDISLLKEEVASLRKQFEELVVSQKDAEVRRSTSAMYTPTGAVLPPPPLSSLPPPPPPPPPPPSFFAPVQKVVVRKQRPRDPLIAQAEKSHEAMLAEVLKGLGTVKLKKVEKSPSGTPLRKGITESESSTSTDPASMLANALKKRFVHIHPPESSDDSAAEAWSPSSPDVQVKRRVGTHKEATLRPS
ncbi:mitochondrial fission regulator 2-like isoform X2 [Dermacentor albipictus]|uniref:mitochondrial fission regulator 2-like isoform X2 n=1 Tax=Dermacentor albipictus TaxID=60249 RepID=UPI0038FCE8D9